jgi:hypothetical protein
MNAAIFASWNDISALLLGSKYCDRARRFGLGADSSPKWVMDTACSGRRTKGDIVASSGLYDSADRVHNDFWLIDRHDVTGLLSDD